METGCNPLRLGVDRVFIGYGNGSGWGVQSINTRRRALPSDSRSPINNEI